MNTKLIQNADFSQGMDHWFFSADDHTPWRTENLWVQLVFDQGWLGLISFMLLLLYSIIYLCTRLAKQDYYAAITLSALAGFLVLGVIDSPLDQPVIGFLFFMLLFIAFLNEEQNTHANFRSTPISSKRRRRRRSSVNEG